MADILIRGMEMPTACSVGCPIFHEGAFNDYCGYGWKKVPREIEKPDWCPLIEAPPHGRLIDADAFISRLEHFEEIVSMLRVSIEIKEIYFSLIGEMKEEIENVPTVIEASEVE